MLRSIKSIADIKSGPVVVLLGLALSVPACNRRSAAPQDHKADPVPVTVGTVKREAVPLLVRAIGNVEAISTVVLKPQVTGRVGAVHFKEGDLVAKGDVLFSIDDEPFRIALAQAEAQLAHDQAAAADADQEVKRLTDLFDAKASTQRELDHAGFVALAAKATVRADEAAIANAKWQLGYCRIAAPSAARTGSLLAHEGDVVKANETPGLVALAQIEPIYVSFAVPERYLAQIRSYMEERHVSVEGKPLVVEVRTPGISPGAPAVVEKGLLTYMEKEVDRSTGTILFKATFENKDHVLWPGQYVEGSLTLEVQSDCVVAPTQAIQIGQQGQYVFVVKQDKNVKTVEQRAVKTDGPAGDGVIISSGLAPGEVVVTDGQLRLLPDSMVTIREPASAHPGAATRPATTSQPAPNAAIARVVQP